VTFDVQDSSRCIQLRIIHSISRITSATICVHVSGATHRSQLDQTASLQSASEVNVTRKDKRDCVRFDVTALSFSWWIMLTTAIAVRRTLGKPRRARSTCTWNFAVLVRQKRGFHRLAGVTGRAGLAKTVRRNVAVLPDTDGFRHGALTNRAQRRW